MNDNDIKQIINFKLLAHVNIVQSCHCVFYGSDDILKIRPQKRIQENACICYQIIKMRKVCVQQFKRKLQ